MEKKELELVKKEFESEMLKAFDHEENRPKFHDIYRDRIKLGDIFPRKVEYVWGIDKYKDDGTTRLAGICQGPIEIFKLYEKVADLSNRKVGLEIGFEKGGTHILFRKLFARYITVEIEPRKIVPYIQNNLLDGRSEFVIGPSSHPEIVAGVSTVVPEGLDYLFIDGDHSYEGCKQDFLNYFPLLNEKGIAVIHDAVNAEVPGVVQCVQELRDAGFTIEMIHDDYTGLAVIVGTQENMQAFQRLNS